MDPWQITRSEIARGGQPGSRTRVGLRSGSVGRSLGVRRPRSRSGSSQGSWTTREAPRRALPREPSPRRNGRFLLEDFGPRGCLRLRAFSNIGRLVPSQPASAAVVLVLIGFL